MKIAPVDCFSETAADNNSAALRNVALNNSVIKIIVAYNHNLTPSAEQFLTVPIFPPIMPPTQQLPVIFELPAKLTYVVEFAEKILQTSKTKSEDFIA
ncbi:MAG: hypothetical protein NC253_15190 [Ruminococcus sp.]|nr:hypothetical protein [Ruminococcus sp.]